MQPYERKINDPYDMGWNEYAAEHESVEYMNLDLIDVLCCKNTAMGKYFVNVERHDELYGDDEEVRGVYIFLLTDKKDRLVRRPTGNPDFKALYWGTIDELIRDRRVNKKDEVALPWREVWQ